MSNSVTVLGSLIPWANVELAKDRLQAWAKRRDIRYDDGGYGNMSDAAHVNVILHYAASMPDKQAHRSAVAVLRRATQTKADYLHRDNSGAVYAAWTRRN